MAIGPSSCGASVLVTRIAVGPSAPPMMPIAAASSGMKPRNSAPMKAANTPNCAAAPSSRLFGLAIRGEKSVIAPTPRKISEG